jgi:putative FmdB family regulatory protein
MLDRGSGQEEAETGHRHRPLTGITGDQDMPLYEFLCRKCGHRFEELLTSAEAEAGKVPCPACGSKRVEREFSAFATGSGGTGGMPAGGSGCGPGGFT